MTLYTVLGSTGYIGRKLKHQLESEGHEVFSPGRDEQQLHSRPLGHVFYCVGLTADYRRNPTATIEAHAGLISRVIERQNFDQLVYLSSTRLYDRLTMNECDEGVTLHVEPTNPRDLYDISKLLGENVCLTGAGSRCAIARLSGVFGLTDDATGFLSEWLRRARNEKSFVLDSGTGIVRDYIHIDDVLRALRTIVDGKATGIFNVASGKNLSNFEIAKLFNQRARNIGFSRETEIQRLPRSNIDRLMSIGVHPRDPRDVIVEWLDRNFTQ